MLFAIILGAVAVSVVGVSMAYAQTTQGPNSIQEKPQIQGSINLQQMVMSSVKTSFSDAQNAAANAIPNGKVIRGGLTMAQGYVVYDFKVLDDKNLIYSVIIDAGNGKVLYQSQGIQMGKGFMFWMGHGGMCHGHHGYFSTNQTSSIIPSGATPSQSQT